MPRTTIPALFAISALAFAIAADAKHVCKHGKSERTVEVTYADAGKKVPCEVKYDRGDGAPAKTIFSAAIEEGFCEKKAADFADKLKGMSYECTEAN